MKLESRRVGAHVSIAGGVNLAPARAEALGCTTAQIFSHNPRQWAVSDIAEAVAADFKNKTREYDLEPVYIHTSYLINLCAPDPAVHQKSLRLLMRELDLADLLGIQYVVLHTGSSSLESAGTARERAKETLRLAGTQGEWRARLLLENTAGEKGDISSRASDLAELMDGPGLSLIAGACIDSCHAFQAGYDVRTAEGVSALAEEVENYLGRDAVRLIHLNDSRKKFGSGVDRHAHIGSGEIGEAGLRTFVSHPLFAATPLVIETPRENEGDDLRNLQAARKLLQ